MGFYVKISIVDNGSRPSDRLFSIYGDLDSYTVPIVTSVPKSEIDDVTNPYIILVPDGTTSIRIIDGVAGCYTDKLVTSDDPCYGITCPIGQECVNGVCEDIDPCEGVTCPTGEVCVNGVCEPEPYELLIWFDHSDTDSYNTNQNDFVTSMTNKGSLPGNFNFEGDILKTDKTFALPPDFEGMPNNVNLSYFNFKTITPTTNPDNLVFNGKAVTLFLTLFVKKGSPNNYLVSSFFSALNLIGNSAAKVENRFGALVPIGISINSDMGRVGGAAANNTNNGYYKMTSGVKIDPNTNLTWGFNPTVSVTYTDLLTTNSGPSRGKYSEDRAVTFCLRFDGEDTLSITNDGITISEDIEPNMKDMFPRLFGRGFDDLGDNYSEIFKFLNTKQPEYVTNDSNTEIYTWLTPAENGISEFRVYRGNFSDNQVTTTINEINNKYI